MNKINIFQTINNLSSSSGGPTKTVLSLSECLNNKVNLQIISNEIIQTNESYLKKFENLRIKYKKKNFSLNPIYDNALEKFISELNVDSTNTIFHDNGIWLPFNNTISNVCRKNSIPIIISSHGMLEPWSFRYRYFKKKLAWYIYQQKNLKNVNVIHATSNMEAENIFKLNLNVPIALIPNGIDKPIKNKISSNFDPTSIGLLKNDQRQIMLFLGRIHPKKGLLNFLVAWKNSLSYLSDWRLVIAGFPEENYLEKLKKFVNKNKIDNSVFFLGPLFGEDLANIYKYSKIFVLPTFSENFGLVVAEALSYGLPTITTKNTPWSLLDKENAGWCCESKITDLERVIKIATNLTLSDYKIMSHNAYQLSKNYDWNKISISFFELYKWILKKGEKPSFVI
tara:strand:+ start:26506 stop:27693 length:1188 start_codon:yes stop_codon:yes gene_type:complete